MSKKQVFVVKGSTPYYGMWDDLDKIISVDKSEEPRQVTFTCKDVTTMCSMFEDCSNLILLDLSNFDTSNVTHMHDTFSNCSSLTALDLSSFNTSKVRDMVGMFSVCSNITTLDLSNFDTSNVRFMRSMFEDCSNLTTIKGVIDMTVCSDYKWMFHNCPKLKGVKIKNPPNNFKSMSGLSKSQYTVVS